MGEVYRARDTKLQRDVAIKVLRSSLAQDVDHLNRFRREALVLASLNHSNVASIYGLEESESTPCVVMELVTGETLADRIKRGRLSINEALPIAIQIAEGVEAAHDKGIIHRDLKPANIKLTQEGKVKVLDFGLAKAFVDADSAPSDMVTAGPTMEGTIVGTPAYMSPEQVRAKALDKRTDIWTFGCLLFEMLAGRQAFTGETLSDVSAAILERQPDWSLLPEKTPPAVRRLVERCLQKDTTRRLRDIGEARIELADVIRNTSEVLRSEKWRTVAFVSTVGLIVVAITLVTVFIVRRGNAPKTADPMAGVVASQLTNYGDSESAAAISPDGRSFVFISSHRGAPDIWLRQISGGEPLRLTNDAAQEIDVTYGTDGETIYFSRRDDSGDSIWQIGGLGGQPRKLINGAHSPAPSPDGRKLAYLSPEPTGTTETLFVSALDRSDKRAVAQNVAAFPTVRAAWSQNGELLSFVRAGLFAPSNLYVIEMATGRERQVTHFDRSLSGIQQHVWLPDNRHVAVSYTPYSRTQVASDLGVLDIADGSISRLTALASTAADGFWGPSVSRDGSRLIATSQRVAGEIWKVPLGGNADANGRAATRFMERSRDPMWLFVSRDMRRLLFNSPSSGSRNLWLMRLDTSGEPSQITSIPGDAVSHSSLSPDGTRVAFVSIAAGHADIWTQNLDGTNARQLTNDEAADAWPVWSPDGQLIVFSSLRNGIQETWLVPSDGGPSRKLIDGFFRGDWFRKPSGEGTWIVTSDGNRNVRLIDVEGAEVVWNKPVGPGIRTSMPIFSPNGRMIAVAFEEAADHDAVQVLETATGTGRIVARLPFHVRFRVSWVDNGTALLVNAIPTISHTVLFDHFWKP
jgi:serine/threonine protein kinase